MTKLKPFLIISLVIIFLNIIFLPYMFFSNQIYETFGSGLGSGVTESKVGGGTRLGGGNETDSIVTGASILDNRKSNTDSNNTDTNNNKETPFYFPFNINGILGDIQNHNSNYYGVSNNNKINRSCSMCGAYEVV